MRRHVLLLSAIALLASCAEGPTNADHGTGTDNPRSPAFDIVDGARGGGVGFFWLPPTVPALPAGTGTFDNSVLGALEVELCAWAESACVPGGLSRRFTSTSGTLFDRIRLFPDRQYQLRTNCLELAQRTKPSAPRFGSWHT